MPRRAAVPASDSAPPSVPQGLRATATSQTAISISWNASTDNVGVTGYRLYRNDSLAGSTASLSYVFSSLNCGTTYGFGIEAVDAAGNPRTGPKPSCRRRQRLAADAAADSSAAVAGSACGWEREFWVDTNGGSCTRSASGAGYSDAAACASFNAAYQAASAGDLIQVSAGTYASQSINQKPSATGPVVVIEAAAGATVVVKELEITASWLTLEKHDRAAGCGPRR